MKKAAIVLILIGLVLYLYKLATSPEEAPIWRSCTANAMPC